MNDSRNLKLGVIFSYITMATGIIISLTYTPFLLRSLGTQQYGLYNMGQAAVSYLGLTEFGFGNAVVRYASKYRAEGNEDKTASMYGMFLYIYSFLATIILIIGAVICIFSNSFYTVSTGAQGYRELRIVIAVMVLNLALTFVNQPYSSIITSYERFAFVKVTNLLYTILKPVVMIPLLLYGYKAIALSVVTFVLQQMMNLANVYYVRKVLYVRIDMKRSNMEISVLKEIVSYSFFIFLGSIVGQLNDNTDNVILGVISGETAVAVYSIGYQLNSYIQQVPGTISSVFFPRVTARITKGSTMEEMTDLLIKVGRIQCYFVFLLISGFSLFGKEFIYLWAGKDYYISYWIVLVLIVPAAIPNMQSIGVLIIQALNRHQFRAILYVVCAILNVVFSIPAGLKFGAIGCAACTGLTTLITSGIIMNWYYQNKIGLNMKFYWKSLGALLAKGIPVILAGIIFNTQLLNFSWKSLCLKVVLYSLIYVIYAYFIMMNDTEKETINNIFVGIKRHLTRN